MQRFAFPLLIGLLGTAILLWLGVWQVQRLEWKRGILDEIASTIDGPAEPLPEMIAPTEQRYRPVALTGEVLPGEVHVLVSVKRQGAGYRIIAPFRTDAGRLVLLDRGFVPTEEKEALRRLGPTEVRGNLHWPDDRNSATPANETERNIWFARDIGPLAETLGTEPLLVIAKSETPPAPGIAPLPVSTEGIPNDHLQYAITWFSLATVWIAMTVIFVRRGGFGAADPEKGTR